MFLLILRAYFSLLALEPYFLRRDFAGLRNKVSGCTLGRSTTDAKTLEQLCMAVDCACIWYWKQVLCLQRSIVTVCLLKRHGIDACMVIGAHPVLFRVHAWVESAGRVVNDKPSVKEIYAVLDYC